jgi:hypothetical protein
MSITKYTQAWVRNFGDVFQLWDAVVSWNAWGRSWFEGVLPSSGLYPLALPASYSLPYSFMGNAGMETFSKASMGLVFLFALGALIELGFRRKEIRNLAWACAYFYPAIQARFLQSHWNSGYADVPLALTTIFAFCLSRYEDSKQAFAYGLVAGTAPLVKQPGLLFASLAPILGKRKIWPNMLFLKATLGAALAALPWYLFIFTRIAEGHREQNTFYLANLVHGGLVARWHHTFSLLFYFAGPAYLALLLILALIGAFTNKEARWWWALFGIPYFFIWGTLFSYDIRNLSMALFPFALAVAAGVVAVTELLEKRFKRPASLLRWKFLQGQKASAALLALTAILGLVSVSRPIRHWREAGSLEKWETEQRLYLGDAPEANRIYADLMQCSPAGTEFLSNYWWVDGVPQLRSAELVSCLRLREAVGHKENAYLYVHLGSCPLISVPNAIYQQEGFAILATNASLPKACEKK